MSDVTQPRAAAASDWLSRDDLNPQLVLLGVPAASGSSEAPDTWETPAAVRRALRRFSTYDSERGVDVSGLRAADWGDWLVAHLRLPEMLDVVRTSTAALPERPTYVFVGGDAIITLPIATSLPRTTPDRTGVLLLGSHRRAAVVEDRITIASLTRRLVEHDISGDHIVHLGVQPFADGADEVRWCEEHGIRVATTAMIDQYGVERVVEEAIAYLEPVVDAIHVSVDLGVLDRAYAPAAASSRPGGLDPRQLAAAARVLGGQDLVGSLDLVGVDTRRDVGDTTIMNVTATLLAFAAGIATR